MHFSVLPGSKLNIICPHVAVSFVDTDDTDSMLYYENIWQVDNTSYQTCNVNTSIAENKIVLKCADPRKMHFTTIVFQRFSAANSHRFEPGRTYYFVSTSNGSLSSLENDRNGHCHTANMKLEIYVCTGPQDPKCEGASNHTTGTTISTKVTTTAITPNLDPIGPGAPRSSSFWSDWHLKHIIAILVSFVVGCLGFPLVYCLCPFKSCYRKRKELPIEAHMLDDEEGDRNIASQT